MQSKQIVVRSTAKKLSLCPMKQKLVERKVSFHLEKLSRELEDGTLAEECVFHADKTRFVTDNNDVRTFAKKSDESVKFADVVRGDERLIMMVMFRGCPRLHLEVPMVVF